MAFEKTISDFLNDVKERIDANIPHVTGGTAKSLQVKMSKDRGELLAAPHIEALEFGRGPRQSPEGGGMWKEIQKWLAAKGMASEMRDAKKLTWNINLYGTRLYQSGRPSGVLSDVINDKMFDKLIDDIGGEFLIEIESEILEQLSDKHNLVIRLI